MPEITLINIMCVGNWNKRIFTPDWVSTHLFELGSEKEFKGIILPEQMEFGYTHNDILLLPKDNTLEIKLEKINKNSKSFSGILMERILGLLPHTPIKALGINIKYTFKKEDDYNLIKILNKMNCDLNEFKTSQIKLTKSYDDFHLNIITDIQDNGYSVNFNFHYPRLFKFDKDTIDFKIIETEKIITNE